MTTKTLRKVGTLTWADVAEAHAAGTQHLFEPCITTWATKNTMPQNAILLCRISDADEDETDGVDDQRDDGFEWAEKNGWGIGAIVVENDTSAYKRKKFLVPGGRYEWRTNRPKYRWIIDALNDGRYDGLLAIDLDRAVRDPRDLEDLIDVVEHTTPRLKVKSLTGSLSLDNDSDVMMSRFGVNYANKSSRDTSRRVARARLRQAKAGKFGGGPRSYGFGVPTGEVNKKGKPLFDMTQIVESEAREIRSWADALLAGTKLRHIVRDLNERKVPTVTGGNWDSRTVKAILLSARVAGLRVYQGEVLEDAVVPWKPIIKREQWEALKVMLADPNRRKSPSNKPKWLLSTIATCGNPLCEGKDNPMRVTGAKGRGYPGYRCVEKGHCLIRADALEAYVERLVIWRMSQPDAVDLVQPSEDVDTTGLAQEANALRARITEAKDLWQEGYLSPADMKVRVRDLQTKIDQIEAVLAAAQALDPLGAIVGQDDVADRWNALDLGRKRAVIEQLMTITILPSAKRGGRQPDGSYFDKSRVVIEWKTADA